MSPFVFLHLKVLRGQERDVLCLRSALPLHCRGGINGITLPILAQDMNGEHNTT